jgi:hypothetical protein
VFFLLNAGIPLKERTKGGSKVDTRNIWAV